MKPFAIIAAFATAYFVRCWLLARQLAKPDRSRPPAEKERSTENFPKHKGDG